MDTAVQMTESESLQASKVELQKVLKLLSSFDPIGSPYIGVQFANGKAEFFRSSANGFAHSKNFMVAEIYVDLHHFADYLKCVPEEIELSVAPNGVLRLYAANGNFPITLFVHTVQKGQAGTIAHTTTGRALELKPDIFAGIDVRHISNLSGYPTISNGTVMIPTNTGAVTWSGAAAALPPECNISPKFSFLKLISGGAAVEDLYVSQNGYWRAVVDGLVVYMKGQSPDLRLFNHINLPGNETCQFTAEALLDGLSGASSLIGDMDYLNMDPRCGVSGQDKFGNPIQWSLDEGLSWQKFRINGAQAKLIVNTLKQAEDERIMLSDVPTDTAPLLRFSRGNFAVTVSL